VIESSPISIVRIGETLVATISGSLDDATALHFQSELAERVSDTQARGVIIDLSAVELVDSFIGRVLADLSATSKLLGARVIVAGIQPAVAITLVELGLTLSGIETATSTEEGLALLGIRVDG